ncbi:MAG TPA: hypothetical protein VJ461_04435 [Candidatus Nanoarchaeia archaeon]|nr:hypothetical protein [Candidatus Nanoarchaeia archaeon]
MNQKIIAVLVLAVFVLSALPLVLAQDREQNGREYQRDSIQVNLGDTTTEDSGWQTLREKIRERVQTSMNIQAINVTECFDLVKERSPNASDSVITSACENALWVRSVLAPKLGATLPRVQRFMVQNEDIIQRFLEHLENKSIEKIKNLDRARLQECLNNTEECEQKIKNWTLNREKVKDMLRQREISHDKLLEAQNKYLRAKNKYLEVKNIHLKARDEFLGLKLRLKECEDNDEDCSALENQTFEKAQEDLTAIADRLIQYLEKVKSKVEAAENLNQTEADEIIDNIDEMIAKLEDAKDAIESAEDLDELKEAAQMIRDVWKDMKYSAFRYAERVIHSEVGQIFSRSELLEKRLETVITRLNDKGVDTTEMEDLLDDFSAKIDDARENMNDANELFSEAKDLRAENKTEEAKDKLEEAKNLTREAHQDLKDAHSILMDLVRMINQKGENFNPDEINEEDEVEVVEEDGDEDDEDEEDEEED